MSRWASLIFFAVISVIVAGEGALAAGRKSEYALSAAEFKRLPQKAQIQYVGDLRNFILALEKNRPNKYSSSERGLHIPIWLWEAAHAAGRDVCFVAHWPIPGSSPDFCPIPRTGEKKITCRIGGQPGIECNPMSFWFEPPTTGKRICVYEFDKDEPPADEEKGDARLGISRRCEDVSKKIKDRDQRIAEWIKADTTGARAREFEQLAESATEERCSSVARQTNPEDGDLCGKVRTRVTALRALVPKAAPEAAANGSGVAATGQGTNTTPPAEVVDTPPSPPAEQPAAQQPVQAAPETADQKYRRENCKASDKMEYDHPVFCNFHLKDQDRYFSLRYASSGSTKVEMWESESGSPTGTWCRKRETGDDAKETFSSEFSGFYDQRVYNKGKPNEEKCDLKRLKVHTTVLPKVAGDKDIFVGRRAYNTNECTFDGTERKIKPKTEDFIVGLDILHSSRYTRQGIEGATPYGVASKMLLDNENGGGLDRFKFKDEVGCPDEATRNLAYALAALQADRTCVVTDPHVASAVKKDDNSNDDYRIRIDTKIGSAGSNFDLQFKSYHHEVSEQRKVHIQRPADRVSVSEWLNGGAHTPDVTPAIQFDGLAAIAEKANACNAASATGKKGQPAHGSATR